MIGLNRPNRCMNVHECYECMSNKGQKDILVFLMASCEVFFFLINGLYFSVTV